MTSVLQKRFYDRPDVFYQDLNIVNDADGCHCCASCVLAMVDESFVNKNAYFDSSM